MCCLGGGAEEGLWKFVASDSEEFAAEMVRRMEKMVARKGLRGEIPLTMVRSQQWGRQGKVVEVKGALHVC